MKTPVKKTSIKSTPNAERGAFIITTLISKVDAFYLLKKAHQCAIFKEIFTHNVKEFGKVNTEGLWQHLFSKFHKNNFASFFLNLDNQCQRTLLDYFFKEEIDLQMPEIPNWEKLGRSFLAEDEELDLEKVRELATAFRDISNWDAYPHDLVWVNAALLFFNNNHITDLNYGAADEQKFGCYINWANYFKQLPKEEVIENMKPLINYV